MRDTAYLILQNGQVFRGERFGAVGNPVAECVFTTGVVGYLETLTDPSYFGQMVVQTFPLIGNYGVIPEDFESEKPRLSAYIVREVCDTPSNFRSVGNLEAYLFEEGIPGLCGVDTRALTRILREHGTMNAAIVSELPENMAAFTGELASRVPVTDVREVSCREAAVINPEGKKHICVWDFGHKAAMVRALLDRGCRVTIVPAGADAREVLALHADGLLLSNGPGDPADNTEIIRNIARVVDSGIPTFGICLGHQLLALAMGGKSARLHYGHRGANQPVQDVKTGKLYSTSQNHGYAIDTLPEGASPMFLNQNDHTNEGLRYSSIRAFSVQFHPEACAGPQDTSYLFDQFLSMLEVR